MEWIVKSLLAAMALTVQIILIGFFARNFSARPEPLVIAWFSGTVVGASAWMVYTGRISELSLSGSLIAMAIAGTFFGALMNVLFFQATTIAPNPALPAAIVNTSSIMVLLLVPVLAIVLPKYFVGVSFDAYHLAGIALTIIGVGLIAFRQ